MSESCGRHDTTPMEPGRAPLVDQPRTRVLIVEDEAAARRLVSSYCDLFDFTCATARSAPEAAAALRRERFDAVLINVHMDDAGPADVTALRALPGPQPPMIGLTAIGRGHEAQRWLSAGLAGVLAKPVTAAMLFAALTSAVVAAPAGGRSWAPAAS
jgi:CheY-like chemotaxis protein